MAEIFDKQPDGIALFDLDGTLIPWDCQLLFRHHVVRREPWRGVFLPVFLAFLPLAGLLKTDGMKRVFLSYLWRMDLEKVKEHSRDFAKSVMPAIYPGLRNEIERHRSKGNLLILASASPEFYVSEIGRLLGFDLVLGTQVEIDGVCRFFPDLDNHKGQAKVDRLKELLPSSYFTDGMLLNCHGYTDSTADLPMLGLCGEVTVVNPSPVLETLAAKSGWRIVRPGRPWISRFGFLVRVLKLLTGLGKDPGGLSNDVGWNQISISKKSRNTSL